MDSGDSVTIDLEIAVFKCCRFYSWTVDYVLSMRATLFFASLAAIHAIRAEETLEIINAVAVPHYDKDTAQGVVAEYRQRARSAVQSKKKQVATGDYSNLLALRG